MYKPLMTWNQFFDILQIVITYFIIVKVYELYIYFDPNFSNPRFTSNTTNSSIHERYSDPEAFSKWSLKL